MAKDKLTDYDSTASNNLDVGGISVAEGMLPSGVNNAIRELMSHQAEAFGAGTPLYVDQTNNRLGVGTTSPDTNFDVERSSNDTGGIKVQNTNNSQGSAVAQVEISGGDNAYANLLLECNATNHSIRQDNSGNLKFMNASSERLRIDSSGNLLVGTTDNTGGTSGTTQGIALSAGSYGGFIGATRTDAKVASLNRTNTDGVIIDFRKDGSTVGSIGTNENADLYIAGGDTGLLFNDNADFISPATATGSGRDNAVDLGYSTVRWGDVYATNGTIQTSDANEKQQIATLTDAEITAAKAISQLFKTFKWNSAVEAKGDAARTHTGVIAQDVEAAMTSAGLDAGDYAFFISSTWYVDADGNEVEADAEGAIEKNRKGIRYPELLAFVGAATEQRLANIETRLAALENV